MERRIIYDLSAKFFKQHFKKLMICYSLIFFVNFMITLTVGLTAPTVGVDVHDIMIQQTKVNPYISVFSSVIQDFLTMVLLFAIVDAYRGQGTLSVRDLIKPFKENAVTLLLAIIIINVISFMLGLIVVIGTLLSAIFDLAAIFSLFILRDRPELQSYQGVVESLKMTRGHKWNLFVISLHYLWIYLVLIGFAVIIAMSSLLTPLFLILFSGIGLFFFQPLVFISTCIYYVTLKRINEGEEPYHF